MQQRSEPKCSRDDFPTLPFATRALCEHIIAAQRLSDKTCLEPACGRGYMSRALGEYFRKVESYDAHVYGFASVRDFLKCDWQPGSFDWVVTNPPFKSAQAFVWRALPIAREGVAMLVRTAFIESVGRYNELFRENPPSIMAQFVERVPIVKGRIDRTASTATSYAWLVWFKNKPASDPVLRWIPPCRRVLERDEDYA